VIAVENHKFSPFSAFSVPAEGVPFGSGYRLMGSKN